MAIAIFTVRLTVDDEKIGMNGDTTKPSAIRLNETFVEELENEIRDRLDKVDTDLWNEADVEFEDAE